MNDTHLPKSLNDSNGFYRWLNQLLKWCQRNSLQSSDSILVTKTSGGTTLRVVGRPIIPKIVPTTNNTGLIPRGIWVSTSIYQLNELVVIQSGASAGTYYSTISNNNNNPSTGIGWLQIAAGNTIGNWS